MRSEDLEKENIKLKKKIENEIKNTVDMERLARKNLQDFSNEYAKNKQYKEFVEYVKYICSTRMTFENPNDDLRSCLDFIDRTFDDLLIRIKDLEISTGANQ
jgi:cell shape-determining protein MreC